ncbi:hypothetical protein KIN20_006296 [Parelaphostrongylus tenuis]|uniref:Uncharacterized protein n=1 Tax=Parelaphostrongylus tenuis TaxID=148309 RepID=A0AAD5M4J8_PARTN|nr:hypothetical protein KIN20_006296 [Parelaphostrongylus tenuis]
MLMFMSEIPRAVAAHPEKADYYLCLLLICLFETGLWPKGCGMMENVLLALPRGGDMKGHARRGLIPENRNRLERVTFEYTLRLKTGDRFEKDDREYQHCVRARHNY